MAKVFISNARPASLRSARRADDDYGVTAQPAWRAIDWRAHLRQLDVAGRPVNYVSLGSGEGPPVVFVHGLGGNWQNWLENIPRLAQERRVVALDLPGFGRSPMPREEISITGYARVVDELCQRLELGPVVVIGNSMGGFTGAEMAIRFPERVERLVLVAAVGISITNLRRRPVMTLARVSAAISTRAAAGNRTVASRPRLGHVLLSTIFRHPTRIKPELVFEMIRDGDRPAFLPALRAMLEYDFRDRLPEIGCPTLLIWGEDDMLVPVEDADEYERLIRGSRKVNLEDTGHVPMAERPETFNRCVTEFLTEEHPPARAEPGTDAEPAAGAESAAA